MLSKVLVNFSGLEQTLVNHPVIDVTCSGPRKKSIYERLIFQPKKLPTLVLDNATGHKKS